MFKYLLFSLITISLFACELVIDIDQPDFDSSLVIQANLSNTQTPLLYVSQDYYILDNELDNYNIEGYGINGATISMYEDDVMIGTLQPFPLEFSGVDQSVPGFYTIDYQPVLGRSYRFQVEKEGFNTATGETTLPTETVAYELLSLEETENQFGSPLYRFEVAIDDPIGSNFYEVEIVQHTYQPILNDLGEVSEFTPVTYRTFIESDNLVVPEYQFERILFTDDIFDGRSFTLTFDAQIFLETFLREDYGLTEDSYVVLKVRSCSEEYYNYYNTAALQSWNDGDPTVEPVPIYTNVENGLGLVGSYYEVADTLFTY